MTDWRNLPVHAAGCEVCTVGEICDALIRLEAFKLAEEIRAAAVTDELLQRA